MNFIPTLTLSGNMLWWRCHNLWKGFQSHSYLLLILQSNTLYSNTRLFGWVVSAGAKLSTHCACSRLESQFSLVCCIVRLLWALAKGLVYYKWIYKYKNNPRGASNGVISHIQQVNYDTFSLIVKVSSLFTSFVIIFFFSNGGENFNFRVGE